MVSAEAGERTRRSPLALSLQVLLCVCPCASVLKAALLTFPPRSTRTVARTQGCKSYEDEPKKPQLSNLSNHTKDAHPKEKANTEVSIAESSANRPPDTGFTLGSAKVLQDYIEEGKRNPRVEPTQNGFNRHIAAWILEQNLPFTAAEATGFKRLMEYARVKFQLPSDTTVRQTLDVIHNELATAVKAELKVCRLLIIYHGSGHLPYDFAPLLAD